MKQGASLRRVLRPVYDQYLDELSIPLPPRASRLGVRIELLEPRLLYAAGDLDLSFGTGGRVLHDLGGDDFAWAPRVGSDGRIVLSTRSPSDSAPPAGRLWLREDGSLDELQAPSESSGLWLDLPDGTRYTAMRLTGTADGDHADFTLARYTAAGPLDPSFGVDGIARLDLNGLPNWITALAMQPDGKILALGVVNWTSNWGDMGDIGLARFNADGSVDTTFGTGGWVTFDFDDPAAFTSTDDASALSLTPEGQILIGGGYSRLYRRDDGSYDSTGQAVLIRLNADGSLDESFAQDGVWTGGFADANLSDGRLEIGSLRQVRVLSDGKLMAVGSTSFDQTTALTVWRFNADGTLDTSYGHGGAAGWAGQRQWSPLRLSDDGSVLALGLFNSTSEQPEFTVVALDVQGRITGLLEGQVSLDSTDLAYVSSGTLDDQGRLVLVGFVRPLPDAASTPDAPHTAQTPGDVLVLRYHLLDEGLPWMEPQPSALPAPAGDLPQTQLPPRLTAEPAPDPALPTSDHRAAWTLGMGGLPSNRTAMPTSTFAATQIRLLNEAELPEEAEEQPSPFAGLN